MILLTRVLLITLETNAVTGECGEGCQFLDMLIMSYAAVVAIALVLTFFIPPLQEPVRYPRSCMLFRWAQLYYSLQNTNVNVTL